MENIMNANDVIRARVDKDLKQDATAVLTELGLTVSDVMRMTLTRIAREKELPFELGRPNAKTRAALDEAREIRAARKARFANSEELFNAIEEEARS